MKAVVLIDGDSRGERSLYRSSIKKDRVPEEPLPGEYVAIPRSTLTGLLNEIDALSTSLANLRVHALAVERRASHESDVYRVPATYCPALGRSECRAPNEDYFTNHRCIDCIQSVHRNCAVTVDEEGTECLQCLACRSNKMN